jgi:tetratricopeptide (TPR) repeat protein
MDRYLPRISPQWAVPLTVLGLTGILAMSVRSVQPPIATSAADAASAGQPRLAIAAPASSRPLVEKREPNWLPSLVDDTRTILTGFALEVPAPEAQPEAGPELMPTETGHSEPTVTPPAPWYPQTAVSPATEERPRLLVVPPEAQAQRSRDLELIAREADLHSRRAFELASNGAYFSARAEFIMALRLVAQALDADRQSRLHCTALSAGLTALKEAEDFLPTGSGLEADLDLARIIAGHRTPLLHGSAIASLTPLAALQGYFTFAQEQLAAAVDREVAGSIALYGLGKLHKVLSEQRAVSVAGARPKAMVFYQAALLTNPENHLASNDLGVLLAQAGRYEDARMALEHSLALHQSAIGWHNLAVVYQNLNQTELARRAEWLANAARQTGKTQLAQSAAGSQQPVAWVDPQTFAQTSGQTLLANQPGAAAPAQAAQPAPTSQPNVARSKFSLPNNKK